MAKAFAGKDYLNLIERALIMGVSDTLNGQITTIDVVYPITAAQLNAMDSDDIPNQLSGSNWITDSMDDYAHRKQFEDNTSIYTALIHHANSTTSDFSADESIWINNAHIDGFGTRSGQYEHILKKYTAKTSGANILINEFNIGATRKETLPNLKAAIDHVRGHNGNIGSVNRSGGVTTELNDRAYILKDGSNPFVDQTRTTLDFTNLYSKDREYTESNYGGTWSSYGPTASGATLQQNLAAFTPETQGDEDGTALTWNALSSTTTTSVSVSDASVFEDDDYLYYMIDTEVVKISAIDTDNDTVTLTRALLMGRDYYVGGAGVAKSVGLWEIPAISSGATIYRLIRSDTKEEEWSIKENLSNAGVENQPPYYPPQSAVKDGFHVYGAFPTETQLEFPAIVVQQVESGFEEKFFGDTVTFGSDTTTSSGEVYGMTFLIHIYTDENTVIPLGGEARYGQRRLINWMMLNIANSIQGMDWGIYEEEKLEILERHLAQWRDIGYMPDAGWYGATAEFDIYFLNKR